MSAISIGQIIFYAFALIAFGLPLGLYMARVYSVEGGVFTRRFGLGAIERGFYKLVRTDPTREQDWKGYAKTVLIFSAVFSLLLYGLLRLQDHLFLNPDGLPNVPSHISLNTTASFVTNTNWQYYGGEYTMSYLSQMAGLAVQNFISAGVGMAVLVAVIRGFTRRSTNNLGNFWKDLYRSCVYILLPLSIVLTIALTSQGVPQTFDGAATATTIEGADQTIARGPVASQIAIKQLGTNGGGFYNSNSAVPFENPNGFTNFLEVLSILLIPAGLVFMFGKLVGARKQGYAIFAAMFAMMIIGIAVITPLEQHGSQVLNASGVDLSAGDGQSGGNMADKEVRFGIANTALWASATTNASNGSVNGGHDALTRGWRRCPHLEHVHRRGDLRRGRLRPVRDDLLHRDRGLRRRPHGRPDARVSRQEDRGTGGEDRSRRRALRPDDGLDHDRRLRRHRRRARFDLQPRRTWVLRGALHVYLAVEQQRERVRRLRGNRLLDALRNGGALPRPLRAAHRRTRDRWQSRQEEDRPGFGRHHPHRRADLFSPARRRHSPDRRPDDLPSARARSDRGGPLVMGARALVGTVVAVLLATVVFGFAYPALMTGFAQLAFPDKADGSLIEVDGKVVGSQLAAQAFTKPEYFHPRPSAVDYNAAGTSFANLGPTNEDLASDIDERVQAILELEGPYNPGLVVGDIPVDAVTTSGSGIDPHISPANAQLQSRRIAEVRGLTLDRVEQLIDNSTDGRFIGFWGEPGVNVLELNLALDQETS